MPHWPIASLSQNSSFWLNDMTFLSLMALDSLVAPSLAFLLGAMIKRMGNQRKIAKSLEREQHDVEGTKATCGERAWVCA